MIYLIRVEGRLGPEWRELAGGLALAAGPPQGRTTTSDLVGPIADEAQLMGVLDKLYTHGARIVRVERLGSTDDAPAPPVDRAVRP